MGTIECSQPASKSSWDSQDFGDISMVLKMAHFRKSTGPRWVKDLLQYGLLLHTCLNFNTTWLSNHMPSKPVKCEIESFLLSQTPTAARLKCLWMDMLISIHIS